MFDYKVKFGEGKHHHGEQHRERAVDDWSVHMFQS